ncbi:alanine racemase [Arthrobacter echini]|uniref:Alanine racemase n=1 Tax=Arthrobacter echini TaxID=1529066 RepID=A0A4V3Z5H4_9MICC|nr:alanine racemase [Arthrobacter echini]THJ65469.1 alanine racemase [Arthrobacter echini]
MGRVTFPERSVEIDLDALRHNVGHLRDIAHPARVMAVVKADAYGHGAVPVARAALEAGAAWLGVAHISEGVELRRAGIEAPILSWLHTPHSDFVAGVENGLDLGISGWELDHVVAAARELERPAIVHLKIDTGLGRNGCPAEKWDELLSRAVGYQDEGVIRVVGVFSHLAVADEPTRPETDRQLELFREAVAAAENAGIDVEIRHLANTPATFSRPDCHFDLVRVGLGIYGLSPFADQGSADLGLKPVMTFSTVISTCKEVPKGQGVSYGHAYRTQEATTLGLIPVGYGDGVPRIATGAPVLVGERIYPVVGRIAMDQLVIDLGTPGLVDSSESPLGKRAVLFGGGRAPAVEDWAAAAQTINYEIVTRISGRVERVHLHVDGADDAGNDTAGIGSPSGASAPDDAGAGDDELA